MRFIKVDIEGADLDVLKGGHTALATAFGAETSFVARNIGAPLQPEIDLRLREAGFRPHLLIREHSVRANAVYGVLSRPQLASHDYAADIIAAARNAEVIEPETADAAEWGAT
jgi:hypothetical protein